jgi:hypothetical protein
MQLRALNQLILTSLLIALLVSCAAPPTTPTKVEEAGIEYVPELEKLADNGQFLDAALAYSKLATASQAPLSQHYSLRAAELLMDGNYVPQSFQLMNEISTTTLPPSLKTRIALLAAQIAIARHLPENAISNLDAISEVIQGEQSPMLLRYHRLRASALVQQERYLDTARELVILEPLLNSEDAIQENQERIVSALQQLPPRKLKSAITADAADPLNGWLDLLLLGQSMAESRDGSDLALWRSHYPQHPALEIIINNIVSARPMAFRLPTQIALILPLNNRFAKAASAIRDGFLAAYYAQPASNSGPSVNVPNIRIYDEGNEPGDVDFAYAQAINDGAEFVVGPLNKDAVNHLAQREELPVPVLALNYSEEHGNEHAEKILPNLFQISLSPEQEARQVAERAWLDGHSRAAIITPDTAWGNRVAKAFSERWVQFDGKVVEKQTYDANKSDYSLPIRRLLNVDESDSRQRALRSILGSKIEFIPRRRQDIDFIFMAASSRQARLIRPQLRFHHAPNIPVYTTSHSYGGTVDPDMDRDMDGVQFSDMPWTLKQATPENHLKADITNNWPEMEKRYSRLYALGIDAYYIIGQLNSLRRNRASYYQGETGDLSLDNNNRLQRRLVWAKFEKGIPQILSEY